MSGCDACSHVQVCEYCLLIVRFMQVSPNPRSPTLFLIEFGYVDHLRCNYSDHVPQEPVEDWYISDEFTPNPDPPAVQIDIPPLAQIRPVAVCHSTYVPRPVDCFAPLHQA